MMTFYLFSCSFGRSLIAPAKTVNSRLFFFIVFFSVTCVINFLPIRFSPATYNVKFIAVETYYFLKKMLKKESIAHCLFCDCYPGHVYPGKNYSRSFFIHFFAVMIAQSPRKTRFRRIGQSLPCGLDPQDTPRMVS